MTNAELDVLMRPVVQSYFRAVPKKFPGMTLRELLSDDGDHLLAVELFKTAQRWRDTWSELFGQCTPLTL